MVRSVDGCHECLQKKISYFLYICWFHMDGLNAMTQCNIDDTTSTIYFTLVEHFHYKLNIWL